MKKPLQHKGWGGVWWCTTALGKFRGRIIMNLVCVGLAKRGPYILIWGGQKAGRLGAEKPSSFFFWPDFRSQGREGDPPLYRLPI